MDKYQELLKRTLEEFKEIGIDVNEIDLDLIKNLEATAVNYTSNMVYHNVEEMTVKKLLQTFDFEFDEVNSLKDCIKNVMKLQAEIRKIGNFAQSSVMVPITERISAGEHLVVYKHTLSMLDNICNFFNLAERVKRATGNIDNKKDYLSAITKLNKKMGDSLFKASQYDELFIKLGASLFSGNFDFVYQTFVAGVADLDVSKLKEEEKPVVERKINNNPEISESEKIRLASIKKANDLYEEFCIDFLRDLEKQVPLSTRDMYREFIDVKFAKFQKTFGMPLDNNVSKGRATEAIYQIQKLIEYIGKIKENSYVTSVYGN